MEKNKSEICIGKNCNKKSYEKRVYGLNLTVKTINKLESIIGYNSRSEVIDDIIFDFVNKKVASSKASPTKTTSQLPTRRDVLT